MFDQTLHDTTSVETFMTIPPTVIIYENDSMKTVMKKFQDSNAWNCVRCLFGVFTKSENPKYKQILTNTHTFQTTNVSLFKQKSLRRA